MPELEILKQQVKSLEKLLESTNKLLEQIDNLRQEHQIRYCAIPKINIAPISESEKE